MGRELTRLDGPLDVGSEEEKQNTTQGQGLGVQNMAVLEAPDVRARRDRGRSEG